ncbi:transcriptional regulator [Halopseudomonas oceani]|nr:MerR family transcriptional regulator [Halopseudomonas oceani]GGE48323.1 transcriptional regulator [Halopseudomonas oceani]
MNEAADGEQSIALETLYPIREVSRLTGVNPITLRAWERRYGLLVPHRTDSGHRLYSQRDIERVRTITNWIAKGVAVSKVASIIDRGGLDAPRPAATPEVPTVLDQWQSSLEDALGAFDLTLLERRYEQLLAVMPLASALTGVLLPVLRRQRRGTSESLLLDGVLRGRLLQRCAHREEGRPSVLLVNLQGAEGEVEALATAALIADAQVNLGFLPALPELPSLLLAAEQSGCKLLVMFSEGPLETAFLQRQLSALNQHLECELAVAGGCCALQTDALAAAGVHCMGGLGQELCASTRLLLAGQFDS